MSVLSYIKKKVLLPILYVPLLVFAESSSSSSQEPIKSTYQRETLYTQSYQPQNYDESYWINNQEEACCENNSFWECAKVPLIGVISGIGGGIIGAEIIGGNRGHHGHRGPAGLAGPAGPAGPGFTADTGQTLTFTLTALFPAVPGDGVSTIPFVTTPDGLTYEGPAIVTPVLGGTIIYAPIVIPNPVFGFYNFGLAITNLSAGTITGISLNGTLISASRDASMTSELTPLAGIAIPVGESQISSTFTYDNANIP